MRKNLSSFIFHLSSSRRGFTLIELLIVIVIIAVLATLLLANFAGIRQRARDGQRKSNLRQIQTALELLRADYGCYPDSSCSSGGDVGLNSDCGIPITAGGTIYMQSVPCDPSVGNGLSRGSPPANAKAYRYTSSDGKTYSLYACLENPNDPEIVDPNENFACEASRYLYRLTNP